MSTDLPEGSGVEIFPGSVAAGIGVNQDSGTIEEPPETLLHEVWVAGVLYRRMRREDGTTHLVRA